MVEYIYLCICCSQTAKENTRLLYIFQTSHTWSENLLLCYKSCYACLHSLGMPQCLNILHSMYNTCTLNTCRENGHGALYKGAYLYGIIDTYIICVLQLYYQRHMNTCVHIGMEHVIPSNTRTYVSTV